jgi:TonB family protein
MTVKEQLVGTVARNSQGLVYREGHRFSADPVDPKKSLVSRAVYDRGAGTSTVCDLRTHFCRILAFPSATAAKAPPGSMETVREDLGSQVMSGLTVTGTRITRNLEFNAPDDDQLTDQNYVGSSTIEIWRSDDLKADLSELRKYPSGEIQDVRLTITSRAEPDPNIFTVPKGFMVRDDRTLRRMGTAGVTAPILVHSVKPEFTELAKSEKISGNVLINLVVDQNGMPANVRVVRGIGGGLDEEAVKAVREYRFKPAMSNGKPVSVELNLEINFQIF